MKGGLHAGVRRWWRGDLGVWGRALDVATAPLEWLYTREVARRNRSAAPETVEGLGVVSVGNLTVGGTGKTPLSAWVARTLADSGVRVALLSRGYGGDEVLLHRRWNPDIPVVPHPDRAAAAFDARSRGARVAVLDDGFQHRRLDRDVDLVLVAAEDPFPGRLLPRGPYREPVNALGRAHGVVVTRRTASAAEARALAREVSRRFPHLTVAVAALLPAGFQTLDGTPAAPPAGPTVAAAAVARPEAFAAHVAQETGADVELRPFPDHHGFTEADVKTLRARAGERTVVVTEKDAVKLERHESILGPARVLAQKISWEEGEVAVTDLVKTVLTPRG